MEHFQQAGTAILQALLIYCKIDVEKKIQELKTTKSNKPKPAEVVAEIKPTFTKLEELKIESLT